MTKKVYDNTHLFGPKDKPQSAIEREREAEMALLVAVEGMDSFTKRKFLSEIGCDYAEYERIDRKYSHLLKRWREEKEKQNG